LVRSLQLVQDRIADGDHAALPMQRKILEMIDARLVASKPGEFSDGRNFRALMIYAMSGGNPATVSKVVGGLILDDEDARLSAGLVQYMKGEMARAAAVLKDIEPGSVPGDVSPNLALLKGTMLTAHAPQESLKYLDYARLAGPGTLIEEAALRRSISLSAEIDDGGRFVTASEQYVRRFLRSPYASQFADAFVAGIVRLHASLDLARVVEVIDEMNPEQAKVIYLRIARQAAIERLSELLAFATRGLDASAPGTASDDPRAALYSALALIASEDVMEVRQRLMLIDASQLSASDRVLLDAAKSLVEEVVSFPATSSIAPPETQENTPSEAPIALAPAEASDGLMPDGAVRATGAESPDTAEKTADEPSHDFVAKTRRQLETIDKLLEDARP